MGALRLHQFSSIQSSFCITVLLTDYAKGNYASVSVDKTWNAYKKYKRPLPSNITSECKKRRCCPFSSTVPCYSYNHGQGYGQGYC